MSLFGQELSSKVRYHWGLDGGNGIIFDGVHENKDEANKAKAKRVAVANKANYKENWPYIRGRAVQRKVEEIARWKNMPIIELVEGQTYTPFGLGRTVIHGKTDGKHSSSASNDVLTLLRNPHRNISR